MDCLISCGANGKLQAATPFNLEWARELATGLLGDECPDLDAPEFPALFAWAVELARKRYPKMGIDDAMRNAFADVFK